MKHIALKHIALIAALIVGSAAHAANYNYTADYDYVFKPALSDAQIDPQIQADTVTCDNTIGGQYGMPSAAYRRCMLQHGWKYRSLSRTRIPAAPADPYFSSNAKVAPGHFIDHDSGMDCQNIGGASVCGSPSGTVHYYDPEQGLTCTRTGLMSICSNM
jgi:hypothetical protein